MEEKELKEDKVEEKELKEGNIEMKIEQNKLSPGTEEDIHL